jgi:hypothetical protein
LPRRGTGGIGGDFIRSGRRRLEGARKHELRAPQRRGQESCKKHNRRKMSQLDSRPDEVPRHDSILGRVSACLRDWTIETRQTYRIPVGIPAARPRPWRWHGAGEILVRVTACPEPSSCTPRSSTYIWRILRSCAAIPI